MKKSLRWIEHGLLAAGIALGMWAAITLVQLHFVNTLAVPPPSQPAATLGHTPGVVVTVAPAPGTWLAKLEAPAAHLSATVLEGSDDGTLGRGAGHIEDTALPGQDGNIGIAGHRDTVFRPVRRLRVGDELDLTTSERTYHYQVAKTLIVKPDDAYVLDPGTEPMLTLVTCYPFEFLGHAPKRYIVQAVLMNRDRAALDAARGQKSASGPQPKSAAQVRTAQR